MRLASRRLARVRSHREPTQAGSASDKHSRTASTSEKLTAAPRLDVRLARLSSRTSSTSSTGKIPVSMASSRHGANSVILNSSRLFGTLRTLSSTTRRGTSRSPSSSRRSSTLPNVCASTPSATSSPRLRASRSARFRQVPPSIPAIRTTKSSSPARRPSSATATISLAALRRGLSRSRLVSHSSAARITLPLLSVTRPPTSKSSPSASSWKLPASIPTQLASKTSTICAESLSGRTGRGRCGSTSHGWTWCAGIISFSRLELTLLP